MPVFNQHTLTGLDFKRLLDRRKAVAKKHEHPRLGTYRLIEEIACQAPDECYHAWPPGKSGWASPLFLRTFPREVFSLGLRDWLQRYVDVAEQGIETIFRLEFVGDRGLIASEYIFGASLADLGRVLVESRRSLSWVMALALFSVVLARLMRLHGRGIGHGRITPRLIRLTVDGEVWLCRGLPHAISDFATQPAPLEPSLSAAQRNGDLVALGRAILPLAGGERASQVAELFDGRDRQAFAVLSDLIIERDPAISDLVVGVLWPLSDPASELSTINADILATRTLAQVSPSEVRQLLEMVARGSPDFHQGHRALGVAI